MLSTCFKPPRARRLGGKMAPVLRPPQHTAGVYENGSETRKTPKHRCLWQIKTVTPPWGLCTLFRLLKKEADSLPKAQPAEGTERAHTPQMAPCTQVLAASFCLTPSQGSHCEEGTSRPSSRLQRRLIKVLRVKSITKNLQATHKEAKSR